MDAILSFFQGIADAITTALDFLVGLFDDVVYIIQLTGKFLSQIPSYFSWLPDSLLTLLLIIFAVVVLYKILGREG